MLGFLIRRLGGAIATWFVVLTLLFFLFRLLPADPASLILDPKMTPEARDLLRRQFGLDRPVHLQYFMYLGNLLQGNFGVSFQTGRPVLETIMERLPPTLLLFTTASVLSFVLGAWCGRIIAWRRGSPVEGALVLAGLSLYTIFLPWFGMLILWIFAFRLRLFPLGGMLSPELWIGEARVISKALDLLHHLVLPLAVLTATMFAGSMLVMRASLLEILPEQYIMTARAKGLPERIVRDRHAARNALLPLITSFALSLAFSMGGGVLTETVFSWPGLGSEIVKAVLSQDFPMAQAAFLLLAGVVILANLIADLLYGYLDPRVR